MCCETLWLAGSPAKNSVSGYRRWLCTHLMEGEGWLRHTPVSAFRVASAICVWLEQATQCSVYPYYCTFHLLHFIALTLHLCRLHCIALHCNALLCIALHCIASHRIALLCFALLCLALHCIALHCIALHPIALLCYALHSIALHCIALHCIALHCIALHCIALHCIALWCDLLQQACTSSNVWILPKNNICLLVR